MAELQDTLDELKNRKKKDLAGIDHAQAFLDRIQTDILKDKTRTERAMIDGINYPDIEEIYEERRVFQLKYLNSNDECKAQIAQAKEKIINEYDREIGELESKMKSEKENIDD